MRCSLPLGVLLALTTHALAEPGAPGAAAEVNDLVARPLVLAEHQVDAELVAEINVAPRQLGMPTSLAPDVWVGVLPRLTVGVIHSNPSVDRFSPGATVCVRLGGFCEHAYHGSGVDALYSVREGTLAVAPRLRFLIRDIDPVKPALTLGALVRWTHGRYAIAGDPYLQLGLANTERGNRPALWLPVTLAVQPMRRWELALRTGINSDLSRYVGADGDRHVATDQWHVPVALQTRVRIDSHVDVGAIFGFASLIGPQNTAKERALFLLVGWRS